MYQKNDKTYYEWKDFEECVTQCGVEIENSIKPYRLVGILRGSITLLHRLSNEYNLPYTLMSYNTYDENNNKSLKDEMKHVFNSTPISVDEVIYIIDDIADTGDTINKTIEWFHEHYPNNKISVFTIFGNADKFPGWCYQQRHNSEWVIFPWEQKC